MQTLAWQEAGEVRGHVVDARGNEPPARVQVQLAGTVLRTITEADRAFQLAGIPPGDYVLHVSTVGYFLFRHCFTLGPGEVKNFEVVLTPASYRTDSVEVKAEPFEFSAPASRHADPGWQ